MLAHKHFIENSVAKRQRIQAANWLDMKVGASIILTATVDANTPMQTRQALTFDKPRDVFPFLSRVKT